MIPKVLLYFDDRGVSLNRDVLTSRKQEIKCIIADKWIIGSTAGYSTTLGTSIVPTREPCYGLVLVSLQVSEITNITPEDMAYAT